ncbi:hypothetical protein DSM112329_05244 [Paraconexibacter sp. AEG42_29]|uniref:Uncharacterized protein n=1 Tax=Paraconexibacter sp. AEG42_29 TaxID=2997339 RepID=A0AAU7B466_9ACTN
MPVARRLSAAVLTLMATFALAGPVTAQEAQPPATDPNITDGTAQKQLDAAKRKWKQAKIRNYQLRAAISCFCPETYRRPRTIKVRNTFPVKPPQNLGPVASVPRMFRTIQGAIDGKVATIGVKYGRYGVPSTITIDRDFRIADEESYYTIDRFKKTGK